MKIKKSIAALGAGAVMLSVSVGVAAPVSAVNNIKTFGTQMTLKDGPTEIGYTVAGISPSSDGIPHQINGRLYESMVTVNGIAGSVTPVVPFFNARAEDGATYRVLANVWTPQGLSGAAVPPGGSSTGKVYFDVVGPEPNSVVFNDGAQDLLAWVP